MKIKGLPFLLVVSVVLLLACNANQKSGSETIVQANTDSTNKPSEDSIIVATTDSVINISFGNNSSVVVLGELKSVSDHIVVNVPVRKNTKLTAKVISTDSLENIRFDKIIYPDGRSNGPLDKNISESIEKDGTMQLIIAHNLMAEGGLTKTFKLKVSFQRQ